MPFWLSNSFHTSYAAITVNKSQIKIIHGIFSTMIMFIRRSTKWKKKKKQNIKSEAKNNSLTNNSWLPRHNTDLYNYYLGKISAKAKSKTNIIYVIRITLLMFATHTHTHKKSVNCDISETIGIIRLSHANVIIWFMPKISVESICKLSHIKWQRMRVRGWHTPNWHWFL